MADYDDEKLANEEETAKMNEEYEAQDAKKARNEILKGLPVYLTDEAAKAAESCGKAAQGCLFLLDYATTPDEKKLLRFAADRTDALCAALGRKTFRKEERFGASGVKKALEKTFLFSNDAAMKLCALAEASGGDARLKDAAMSAVVATQALFAVCLLQI